MVVEVLTLPRRNQIFASVLSTTVAMCSGVAMRETKRWRWSMYVASSRSLMVKNPWGFSSVTMLARMAVLNFSRRMCHSIDGLYQTPHMPGREASVAPIHVGGVWSDFS